MKKAPPVGLERLANSSGIVAISAVGGTTGGTRHDPTRPLDPETSAKHALLDGILRLADSKEGQSIVLTLTERQALRLVVRWASDNECQ